MKVIDISRHQGAPDFDLLEGDGVVAVICKATEGRGYIDPQFSRSWSELVARQPRMIRGAYHFARVDSDGGDTADAIAEAEDFCRALLDAGDWMAGALPPALDVEWGGSAPGHKKNQDWIRAWIDTVTERLGRAPMIYAGENYWRDRVGNSTEWVDLPLWRPDINNDTPESTPWETWTFHQHSVKGAVSGINGDVDLNRFNGTIEDLRALALLVPSTSSGIFASFDLASTSGARVKLIQGRLMAHGFGPDGLVGSDGLPDGIAGAKTLDWYARWLVAHRRPVGSLVDGQAWVDFARE